MARRLLSILAGPDELLGRPADETMPASPGSPAPKRVSPMRTTVTQSTCRRAVAAA